MILRRDFDLLREQVLHRMIRAMMAEPQLERFPAKREPAQLVSQTDSENRYAPQHRADGFDRVSGGPPTARAPRQQQPLRVPTKHRFSPRLFTGGHHLPPTPHA